MRTRQSEVTEWRWRRTRWIRNVPHANNLKFLFDSPILTSHTNTHEHTHTHQHTPTHPPTQTLGHIYTHLYITPALVRVELLGRSGVGLVDYGQSPLWRRESEFIQTTSPLAFHIGHTHIYIYSNTEIYFDKLTYRYAHKVQKVTHEYTSTSSKHETINNALHPNTHTHIHIYIYMHQECSATRAAH